MTVGSFLHTAACACRLSLQLRLGCSGGQSNWMGDRETGVEGVVSPSAGDSLKAQPKGCLDTEPSVSARCQERAQG